METNKKIEEKIKLLNKQIKEKKDEIAKLQLALQQKRKAMNEIQENLFNTSKSHDELNASLKTLKEIIGENV